MIRNELQYRITKEQARLFAESVRAIEEGRAENISSNPLMAKVHKDALTSQLADLENDMREYDDLKRMILALYKLDAPHVPPHALVEARAALGITAKDFAERVGLEERQILVYEETNYASADDSRMAEVVSALRACRDGTDSTASEYPRA